MSVFKRESKRKMTKYYHYRFMYAGNLYYGVCTGCTEYNDALWFEKQKYLTAQKAYLSAFYDEKRRLIAYIENSDENELKRISDFIDHAKI